MPYISFGDKDRERWGLAEEWVEFDPSDITVVDLQELSDRFGFDYYDWPEPLFGEIPFEQAGSPDAKRVRPLWHVQALVWMALRQNDIPVAWEDAGTARSGRLRLRAAEPESPGKDSTPATPSRRRADSTTTPSSTSGRRSHVKS
jgi:hypothetical protein